MSSATFESAVESALRLELQVRRQRYLKLAAWGAVAIAALWYSAVQIKLSPVALVNGAGYMWDFITRLFPPDLSYLTVLGGATVETVQIAIWGTLLAIILSIPLSFLGARNTSPHIVVFHLTRLLLNALRAINELVFALIFVSAVGLGPFAGVLAVALHATGMLAKFCAEEIEGVDKGQVEAQMATGALAHAGDPVRCRAADRAAIHRLRDLSPRRQHPLGHRARPCRGRGPWFLPYSEHEAVQISPNRDLHPGDISAGADLGLDLREAAAPSDLNQVI